MPQDRFDGMVAVVTGGSNEIGRAITQGFAQAGARVVICDLARSGFFAGDERVATVTGDIASPGVAGQVIAEPVSRWGKADILVNDAASYPDGTLYPDGTIYPGGTLLDMSADAWSRVLDVNVTGTFMMTQAFARHCVQRGARSRAASGARR